MNVVFRIIVDRHFVPNHGEASVQKELILKIVGTMCACVRACLHACVRACVCVFHYISRHLSVISMHNIYIYIYIYIYI